MDRSGQCLFLPRARFKTKGESEGRLCCIFHNRDLYVEKLKWIYPPFLGGPEDLAMDRSGQCLFLPRARFETKGESESRSSCILPSRYLYGEKLKWMYTFGKSVWE
ncbi:hypothetical protein WAZ07_13290 [Bacillus sp. FJAT-51639]|uniref:Uncharacterized protein n=1 Tax=Bacillus bruguierae TaxID=3127667 RepID=A0ABU8FK15_9BACI